MSEKKKIILYTDPDPDPAKMKIAQHAFSVAGFCILLAVALIHPVRKTARGANPEIACPRLISEKVELETQSYYTQKRTEKELSGTVYVFVFNFSVNLSQGAYKTLGNRPTSALSALIYNYGIYKYCFSTGLWISS